MRAHRQGRQRAIPCSLFNFASLRRTSLYSVQLAGLRTVLFPVPCSLFLPLVLVLLACASSPTVGSIGVVLGRDGATHSVFVREVPEAKNGAEPPLLPGDEILMVDGHYVRQLSSEELRRRLRGAPGSKVKLTVVRGGEILRLEVVRTSLKQSALRPGEERLEE